MRYLLLISVLLLFALRVIAQPGFGPEIGLGMSSMRFAPEFGFTSASTSSIFSGKIGGIGDFCLSKHLYVQTGIFVSIKGQSREFSFFHSDSLNEAVNQTLSIYYADVPITVVFKTGIQGKGRVIIGLGLTPSYILGGINQLHLQGSTNDTPYNYNIKNPITNGKPVSMFDIGLNIIGGYELPTGLFFKAYYTAGVRDIGLGGEIDKNRMWGISAGYIFGKGRNIKKEIDDLIDRSPQ